MTLWMAVALVAVLVALDKSFIPGAAILGVGFLASVMPAREASGITLALIIIADWTAIWAYRRNVNWSALRRLLPNVVIGVLLGAVFLLRADDSATGRTIGIILLVFLTWNVAVLARGRVTSAGATGASSAVPLPQQDPCPVAATATATGEPPAPRSSASTGLLPDGEPVPGDASSSAARPRRLARRLKSSAYGALAGFTTMVANAGGPVTSMYFLSEGFPVMSFLGTSAWFYLVINLVKLPFSLGLGMLTSDHLPMILMMIPVIIITVVCGRWCARRISPSVFSRVVIVLTFIAALQLTFR